MSSLILELPNAIQQADKAWTRHIEVDELTGKEQNLFAGRSREKTGAGSALKSAPRRLTEILSRCSVAIGGDTRPDGKTRYDLPDYFKAHWATAYSSDRIFALVRIRQHTFGNKYKFDKVECPTCEKKLVGVVVDLSEQEYLPSPYEWATAEVHSVKLPKCGDVVTWRPLQGEADEEASSSILQTQEDSYMSGIFARRIVTVNGSTLLDKDEYTSRLSAMDMDFLGGEFALHEGGLDLSVEIVCNNPACKEVFSRRIEPMSPSFFFPSTSSTTYSTKRSLRNAGNGASKTSDGSL